MKADVGQVLRGMMLAHHVQGKALAVVADMHPSAVSRALNVGAKLTPTQVLQLGVALGRLVERRECCAHHSVY